MTDETRKLIDYILQRWEYTDAPILQFALDAEKAEKKAIEKARQTDGAT